MINQHINQLRHDKTWNVLKKRKYWPLDGGFHWPITLFSLLLLNLLVSLSVQKRVFQFCTQGKKILIMREIMNRLCALASGTFGFDESTTNDIIQLLRENPLILEQEIGSHFCILCASFWKEIRCERCKRVRNYLKFLSYVSRAQHCWFNRSWQK